ncbi:MAG: dCTP deaminase, partial [candidate division Zixibacteria bacterium]|nr:dCTP deaminase [candidate division Zixibacteria bacterium]
MPVKSDRWIIEMAREREMIKPFSEEQVRSGISYGTSSYGYDISLSDEFKVFDPRGVTELDPTKMTPDNFQDVKAESVLIPANSFVLGRTVE